MMTRLKRSSATFSSTGQIASSDFAPLLRLHFHTMNIDALLICSNVLQYPFVPPLLRTTATQLSTYLHATFLTAHTFPTFPSVSFKTDYLISFIRPSESTIVPTEHPLRITFTANYRAIN